MKYLENPIDYLNIIKYTPWLKTQEYVSDYIVKNAKQNSSVLDLMCGPGYILSEISKKRKDLDLTGLDINSEFIDYSNKNYSEISFILNDVLKWENSEKYDYVICTGGFHHLLNNEQPILINKLISSLKPDGEIIIADPFIGTFCCEEERKLNTIDLGIEYIKETIINNGGDKVITDTIEILKSDILNLENKTSFVAFKSFISSHLSIIDITKAWSSSTKEFGDYVFKCKSV